MKKLRALEDENGRLKKLVANQALEIDAIKLLLEKKVLSRSRRRKAARILWEAGFKAAFSARIMRISRSTCYYKATERNAHLARAIRVLAYRYPSNGYRVLHGFLRNRN